MDAVCAAFEAHEPPSRKRANLKGVHRLKDQIARARASALASLYRASQVPGCEAVAVNLERLSARTALSDAGWDDIEAIAIEAWVDFRKTRAALLEQVRETPVQSNAGRAAVISRVALNDDTLDESQIRKAHESFPLFGEFRIYQWLLRQGRMRDAALQAEALVKHGAPVDIRAKLVRNYPYWRPGAPFLPPLSTESYDEAAALHEVQFLIAVDEHDRARVFADGHKALIATSADFAATLFPLLKDDFRQSAGARERLAESLEKAPFRYLLKAHAHGLLDTAGRHESLTFEERVCLWGSEILDEAIRRDETALQCQDALDELTKWRPGIPEVCDPGGRIEHALLQIGPDSVFGQQRLPSDVSPSRSAVLRRYNCGALEIEEARLSAAGRAFIDSLPSDSRPVVVFGNHSAGENLNEIASALLGRTGREVLSLTRQPPTLLGNLAARKRAGGPDGKYGWNVPVRRLDTDTVEANEQTRRFLEHLNSGGILEITNDQARAPGVRCLVPWLDQPYVLRIYGAQLALAKRARVAFKSVWIDTQGKISADFAEVPLPPDQGSPRVQAIRFNQKIARSVRNRVQDLDIRCPPAQRLIYGGYPQPQPGIPLAEWQEDPKVRHSVAGWIANSASDLENVRTNAVWRSMDAAALARPAQCLASMIQHFQASHGSEKSPRPRLLDRFRMAFILPKGEAFLTVAAAGLATGCLLCPNEDDVAPEELARRLSDFAPDLVIAGASVWSRLLECDSSLENSPVLIADDKGGLQAVEELTQSFSPVENLPRFDSDAPGIIVYTSGSDGTPKGVVLPAGLLSSGAGLDRMMALNAANHVLYLTRWDAVGLLDLLACLRSGARICLPPHDALQSPGALMRGLADEKVDTLSAPASLWRLLSQSKEWKTADCDALRQGLIWGERIPRSLPDNLWSSRAGLRLFCIYGSTEATFTAFGELPGAFPETVTGSPGGWTCPSVKIELLTDPTGTQTASIEGPDVMIGYWDQLKQEKPSIQGPAPRRFKTADQIAIDSDGRIDVKGRSDSIVKIFGKRIALTSLEAAAESVEGVSRAIVFMNHEAVQAPECSVVVETGGSNRADLHKDIELAVFTASGGTLRPRSVQAFDAFPLLSSGKVDRRALRGHEIAPRAASDAPANAAMLETRFAFESDPGETAALGALLEWAQTSGSRVGRPIDPDTPLPGFSSIEMLELNLLSEELGGSGAGLLDSGPASLTWRGLARRLVS